MLTTSTSMSPSLSKSRKVKVFKLRGSNFEAGQQGVLDSGPGFRRSLGHHRRGALNAFRYFDAECVSRLGCAGGPGWAGLWTVRPAIAGVRRAR